MPSVVAVTPVNVVPDVHEPQLLPQPSSMHVEVEQLGVHVFGWHSPFAHPYMQVVVNMSY
jgi:hypothetical protein